MKILFVDFNHSYGGGQVYVKNTVNYLEKIGINCWLMSNNPANFFNDIQIAKDKCIEIPNSYFAFYNISRKIKGLIVSYKITNIIFNGNRAMYLAPFVKCGNKSIITHTMPNFNSGIKYMIYKFALILISNKYINHVIVLSDIQSKALRNIGVKKEVISIVYNGVNEDFFYFNSSFFKQKKELIITVVANLEKHKGHQELINVFRMLIQKYTTLRLWIIGSGNIEYENYLKRQINIINKDENKIVFWGYQKNVKKFLRQTDIFVLPSHKECLPISLLEAMATSLPIVVSDVGGISEIIEDGINGYLIEPKNEVELYNSLEKLILNESDRKRIAISNYEKAKKSFCNKHTIEKLINILKKHME